MSMIASQILKLVDSPKTQKSKHFKDEALFFILNRKFIYGCKIENVFRVENSFISVTW